MAKRNHHPRFLLRVVVVCAAIATGAWLVMGDDQVLKIIGAAVVALFLVIWFGSDVIDAWLNERHVETHPHLLKNEAIGQTVSVIGDFVAGSGTARGYVLLNGEKWRALSSGPHVPKQGERLHVQRREGLILHVRPRLDV